MPNESNDLKFQGNDPGAVKYGNFINYYTFHNVKSRIELLNHEMLPIPQSDRIICLDVGCNTGELTASLYSYLKNRYSNCSIHILGIDIDPILIARAQESNNVLSLEFVTANIMDDYGKTVIRNYLEQYKRKTFDITFCFSVTMWIHLNNDDEGLIDFLKYIQGISMSIIIEPQPWKCYRNAQKRLKKAGSLFEKYESLKIRSKVESVIENTLLENFDITFVSLSSKWDRKIQCYQLKSDNNIRGSVHCTHQLNDESSNIYESL